MKHTTSARPPVLRALVRCLGLGMGLGMGFGIGLAWATEEAPLAEDGPPAVVQALQVAQAARPESARAGPRLQVQADGRALVADGSSRLRFEVRVFDAAGQPWTEGVVTVQAKGGARISQADGDPTALGGLGATLNVPVQDGLARFELLAPSTPGEVQLQVTSGALKAQTVLHYAPQLRDMLAIGVVEGVLSKGHLQAGSITPAGFNDGFEQEIVRWSRDLGDDSSAALRTAFYLKGKIRGDVLLTAAFDSDKESRQKLAQTIDPQAVYPVYGDASTANLDARSGERLYVRLDHERSFLLYGDFSTTGTLPGALATPVPGQALAPPVVLLGRYQRSATGLRAHLEDGGLQADAFVISDTLKQLVEEYPANGTSGPFAVANSDAVQDSERVEILVRDRNQRDLLKSVTPLQRFVDYSFEPFSGRILLLRPLATLTPQGDPQSLRISYEADQGGTQFMAYGVAADVPLMAQAAGADPALRLGATAVVDENPLAPYQLHSVHAELRQGDSLQLVLEAAQSQASRHAANGNLYPLASSLTGELDSEVLGQATRLEVRWHDRDASGSEGTQARLWWTAADAGFSNVGSGVVPARTDSGVQARTPVADELASYMEVQQTQDTQNDLVRQAATVGLQWQRTPELTLDLALRHVQDNTSFAPEAALAANAQGLGTGGGGGFFGSGTSSTVIDPVSGLPLSTLASTGSTPGARSGTSLEATTARLGFGWQKTPAWRLHGELESSLNGTDQQRLELGTSYALSPVDALYARAESQTGLASPASLNYADRSTAVSAGLAHASSADTTLFSEYRMLDANQDNSPSSFDQMLVNGLQQHTQLQDGLVAHSGAEYLSVLSGNQRQALALTGALDWTVDSRSRAAAKLEYRRLFDASAVAGDQTQDQWLSTLSYARKLDGGWTLLLKNYYLCQENHDDASGQPLGNARQERFLSGFAWRPRADNRFNALARYEYKAVDDGAQLQGERYSAHIGSVSADYHPKRAWWSSGRLAAKSSSDYTVVSADQSFNAWLASARFTWDIGSGFDLGVLASTLRQANDTAARDAWGVEAGYLVKKNLWISVGYNWSGFFDRDLSGSDYTRQGIYLRLRAKFDEELWTRK